MKARSPQRIPKANEFAGRWVAWKNGHRFEQELYDDGSFEAVVVDGEDTVVHVAIGNWKLDGDSIHWRYKAGGPRSVDKNKLIHLDKGQFSVLERDRVRTDFYRTEKSVNTHKEFDLPRVPSFLKNVSTLVDDGFGTSEINKLTKRIKGYKRHKDCSLVFPIVVSCRVVFERAVCSLCVRVMMHDTKKPDVCFSAPPKLIKRINKEMKKFEA
jgi:hypothetical protein